MLIEKKTPVFFQDKPVGLTGGIASGKSTVVKMFRDLGAITISADTVAKTVLASGKPALKALAREFGPGILLDNGALNRHKMLHVLLDQPGAMEKQLHILKPFILPAIDEAARNAMQSASGEMVIVEAPLLFEYGYPERYHPILLVTVSREMQIQRLMRRSGNDRDWAVRVVDLQWPLARKEQLADIVIRNDTRRSETGKQVKQIYKRLKASFIR
jgi:dephospho-CoA kinase